MRSIKFKDIFFSVLALVLCTMTACGQMERVMTRMKAKYSVEVSAEMRRQFDLAEFHYRRRHFDEANFFYQEFINRYGHNALTDEAYYKQGKLYFLKRDYATAISRFEALSKLTPSDKYRSKAWHLAGYSAYKAGDYAMALKYLKKVQDTAIPAKLRLQYYSVVVNVAKAAATDWDLALRSELSLYDLYREQASSFRYLRAPDLINFSASGDLIEAWLSKPMTPREIPQWLRRYPSGPAKPYIDFKIAKTYYEAGDSKRSRKLLTLFVEAYPKHEYHAVANEMLAKVGGPEQMAAKLKSRDVSFKIGVLAPFGGARGSYGQSVLQGIKCAVGAGGVCGGNSRVEVVVQEAGETGNSVRDAVKALRKAGVAAIVGILPGELAVEGALAAGEEKLPLLMISQKKSLMKQSDHVYQMGMTTEQQVAELVKAARDRGMKNFAVFYPSIRYGTTMAELFTAQVLEQGGSVVAKTPYERRSPDLFAEARKLKNDARLTGRGAFDAIFIPDTYAAVNALAGALEFNGIKGMALLGTNTWNHPGLNSSRIEGIFPGSFFVDLYDVQSRASENQAFRKNFLADMGQEPQVLPALGYDAATIVRKVISSGGEHNVQKSLSSSPSFKGVTGVRSFRQGEGPVILPHVIELKTLLAEPAE